MVSHLLIAMLGLAVAATPAIANPVAGPLGVSEYRVVDGDTIAVLVEPWPGVTITEQRIRIRGIDAPESFQPKCPEEREAGKAATAYLTGLLKDRVITLGNIARETKFAGMLADVYANGDAVADRMIVAGHARRYDGKTRAGWCGN